MNTDSYIIALPEPTVVTDRFRLIQDLAFSGTGKLASAPSQFFALDGRKPSATSEFFAFRDDKNYSNVVGKRVLCKAQGLTGQERRLCEAQILAKCGRKPHAIAITKKQKADNAKWEVCGQGVSYTPVGDLSTGGGTSPKDSSVTDTVTGAGTDANSGSSGIGATDWKRVAIYAGAGILLIGGIIVVSKGIKNRKAHTIHAGSSMR